MLEYTKVTFDFDFPQISGEDNNQNDLQLILLYQIGIANSLNV